MNKLKLIALLATGSILFPTHSIYANDGWGKNQTKDTISGLIIGGALGGIVGHQQDKQKEGIIIGSILGSIIGNKGGKGKDSRNYNQSSRFQRYSQSRTLLYDGPYAPSTSNTYNTTDPEVLAAKQRAEALERQVQQEKQRIIAEQQRVAMLQELHAREQAALEQLRELQQGKK